MVKVVAAVLTYRAKSNGRLDWLGDAVRSLAEADEVLVIDNGSDDGSDDWVRQRGGWVNPGVNHTSGHGTNLCAQAAIAAGADLVVLSDDDIAWAQGWREMLESWWDAAPDNLVLTGCHLEPDYPWNERKGALQLAGIEGILRNSTGAGTWTFLADRWFGPIPEQIQGWGDVPACHRIIAEGGLIAQIDLAEHRGEYSSTWGNASWIHASARP